MGAPSSTGEVKGMVQKFFESMEEKDDIAEGKYEHIMLTEFKFDTSLAI